MLTGAAIMKNVIGSKGQNGKARFVGIEEAYKIPNVNVHNYGKEEVKEGRKMGHITITGKNRLEVEEKVSKIKVECIAKQ
jgi:5-(carboxyamino)imidazole ribonucleotide synthase